MEFLHSEVKKIQDRLNETVRSFQDTHKATCVLEIKDNSLEIGLIMDFNDLQGIEDIPESYYQIMHEFKAHAGDVSYVDSFRDWINQIDFLYEGLNPIQLSHVKGEYIKAFKECFPDQLPPE